MVRSLGILAAAVVLAFAASAAASPGPERFRVGDDWYRIERGAVYRVNPEVITVRFAPTVSDLPRFVAIAGPGPSGIFARLETIRSNRLGFHDLRLPSDVDPFDVLDALRATGLVEAAEENTLGRYDAAPSDPQFSNQWALDNTGQTGGTPDADVDAPEAWDLQTGVPGIVVAVVDSGTDIDHEDLVANLWKNLDEIPGNGQDDDANGYVDDVDGWDFYNGNNDPRGPYFHGTHVAGIVAATTDNGIGIAGLAGGGFGSSGARIMPLGVGDFSPDASVLDDAILYAADNGAKIITLSLTVGQSSAIDAAIEYAHDQKGVFLDCAAGNASGPVAYPANHPMVIAVAATDANDNRANFSNFGPEIELAAPGVGILSTQPGNSYGYSDGTSFAAPHVAGLAALVFSAAPDLGNDLVRQLLRDTADDIGDPGYDEQTGDGRINALAAVELVSDLDPPAFASVTPSEGTIFGGMFVTITGANFYGNLRVRFDGILSGDVIVESPTSLRASVPHGVVLGPVDVKLENGFGSDIAPGAFTYTSRILALGEPHIGGQISVHVVGPPLQNWGLVKDLALGPTLKKGLWWDLAFSPDREIVQNSWKGIGAPLNGIGQGSAVWAVPDDPTLIGQPIYFQAVFDNLPGTGTELVLSDLLTVIALPGE